MRFMSDFREAMWGVVQQAVSELDFDFDGYARTALRAAPAHGGRRCLPRGARAGARARTGLAVPTLASDACAAAACQPSLIRDAQAVVIGGGVGGCSILYWLTQLGWRDVVLCERADLTSGSTFHSAGLVGQLRGSLSLTRMMMESVDLYRRLGSVGRPRDGLARGRLAAARVVRGADGGAPPAGGLGEDVRPAARARLGGRGAATSSRRCRPTGVLGAAYLPTDGYIDPSQLTFALAEGARRGGADVYTGTRVTGHPGRAWARDRRRHRPRADRDRGRDQRGRHVRGRARPSRRRERADRPDGARVPDHAPERAAARPADDARPHAPRLLPRRVGRARHGRLRARSGAVGSRRHPGRLQRAAAGRGLGALRGADDERDRAGAGARGAPRSSGS